MSTENRVENKLSAMVARRSFRQPIDNTGMGFQEELLSLTFESKTELPAPASPPTTNSSSVNQSQTSSEQNRPANNDEDERPELENPEFALLLPLPQQPVNNAQPESKELDLDSESPHGTELVKRPQSVEKTDNRGETKNSFDRSQPTVTDRDPRAPKLESKPSTISDQTPATELETSNNKIELEDNNGPTDLNTLSQPAADSTANVDTQSVFVEPDAQKTSKKSSTDKSRSELVEDSEPIIAEAPLTQRDNKVEETVSSQDSLAYEQDAAPTRNRRPNRQDRIRDENTGRTERDGSEANQLEEKEALKTNTSVATETSDEFKIVSNALEGTVLQSTFNAPIEANYSVAGQAGSGQTDSVIVNASNIAGAAGASVTGAISGTMDQSIANENSSIQPLVSGSGKSESAANTNRGTGRAEGSTGSSALSQFQQNKLVQRVLKGLEQLSTGGGQVKLRLHPPELGTLQMTLKIEANVMSAHLEVENSLAKDALLNNLQSLRDKLNEQGMSIDRFEVEVRTDSQSGTGGTLGDSESNRQSRRDQPESRYAIYNENRLASDEGDDRKSTVPWFRTTGQLDLSV